MLDGTVIEVPAAFTGADLAALQKTATADDRLALGAEHAEDGQVTQYLAGGPALPERYRTAPPTARALIHADRVVEGGVGGRVAGQQRGGLLVRARLPQAVQQAEFHGCLGDGPSPQASLQALTQVRRRPIHRASQVAPRQRSSQL